jgi:hypothetical protein
MEINSATNTVSNPVLDRPQTARTPVLTAQPSVAPVTGVQDKVTLSAAALKSAAASSDSDQDSDTDNGATEAAGADSGATDPSAVKSFVYGTLGLERPGAEPPAAPQPQAASVANSDSYYNAGRWLAAAATVGTIVSLLA